jgi:alpha-L-fucosidase
MWDTKTTEFNIMNTPYGKDIVKQYVEACREVGLKVGFYYSPEDWLFLRKKGALIKRRGRHDIAKPFRKEYDAFVVDQLKELLTNYGKIDIMFLDGGYWPPAKKACWDLQPDILITRGALNSPEQTVSDIARENAWEACITMNNQWAYKPTNKKIKHGTRIIEILIETRAKGGALALNIGPKPDGELDIVEEETFREVAAWNFVNYEAINGVRPWIVTNEKNIWLSRKGNTVYAYITKIDWERGERKEFLLNSIKATEKTKISVIGQNDIVCEYQYVVPKSKFEQTYAGLNISVVRAQRIYNANDWDNPIVVKIENVEPSFDPIQANLLELKTIRDKNDVISYSANIDTKIENLKIGVLYREYNGFHESIYADKWEKVEAVSYKGGQTFTNMIKNLNVNKDYQMRLYVIQNGVQIDGKIVKVRRKK